LISAKTHKLFFVPVPCVAFHKRLISITAVAVAVAAANAAVAAPHPVIIGRGCRGGFVCIRIAADFSQRLTCARQAGRPVDLVTARAGHGRPVQDNLPGQGTVTGRQITDGGQISPARVEGAVGRAVAAAAGRDPVAVDGAGDGAAIVITGFACVAQQGLAALGTGRPVDVVTIGAAHRCPTQADFVV
jgi:hypothetical protein